MKDTKLKVKKFMEIIDTSNMWYNEFAIDYTKFINWSENVLRDFLKWPSVETISRSRRYVISKYSIGYRRGTKELESEYIEEFVNDGLITNF